MASFKELNEITGNDQEPQPAPLNFDHVSNADDVFSFILKGIKETPTNGNRNNFVHIVASDCNRFAVSENDALNFLMQYQEKDFTGNEIRQAVRSAYQRIGEHGTKQYTPKSQSKPQATKLPESVNLPTKPTQPTTPPIESTVLTQLILKTKIDLNAEMLPPDPAISYKGVSIGTLGNFTTVIGKAKSRKSFLATMFAGATLRGNYDGLESPLNRKQVIYFDTEQSQYYVQQAGRRIIKIAGNNDYLTVHALRTCSPSERLAVIEKVLQETKNIGLIVIDGIRDLITSINDEAEASNIATKLLKWSEVYNIHIVTILHQNKGNEQARGHVGTELINKSETVISVTKDENSPEISFVKFDFTKNLTPENFAFTVNDTGIPVMVDDYQPKQSATAKKAAFTFDHIEVTTHLEILKAVFANNTELKYSELHTGIIKEFAKYDMKFGESKARDGIKYFEDSGLITSTGTKGTRYCTYHLSDGIPF